MTVMLPQTGRPNNTITYRRRSWLLSLSGKYGGLETIAWEMANMTLFDLVEPEVTHKVPKHWHSFPPPHPLWHPVLGTLYAIIGLFALFGNGVVLWVFCCTRSLRSGTNLLVINLAFSDLCMVISQFPFLVCNCFSQAWVMGPFVCELYGFCGALFGTMSIINLAVIAYDRYRAILSPFGGTQLSMRRAGLWLLLIWVYSGGWCALPFFGWNQYVLEGLLTSTPLLHSPSFSSPSLSLLLHLSFPLPPPPPLLPSPFSPTSSFLHIYPCISITTFIIPITPPSPPPSLLRQLHLRLPEHGHLEQIVRGGVVPGFLRRAPGGRLLRLLRYRLVSLTSRQEPQVTREGPRRVVSLMGVFSFYSLLTPLTATLSALFAKVSTVYNPFIYAVSHHRYRQELGRRLPWLCCVLPMETFPTSLTSRPSSVRNEKAQADLPSPHTLVQSMTPVPFLIDSTK
ncbi:hypothetical protein Pcinc_002810 [Petrolisthes cinctipes]|uniref:G-protein coupled receptors family 1 profile domain-containing protein n=1 Tax=Petrolisthes cinctipes TaxID=88211 RepID=A0AAE1L337_PETCI|nr:hypothetical protein Pcinc_002810 [Petrolisthes cinctipes]